MAVVSPALIHRYTAPPSPSKVRRAALLQRAIRAVLGSDYETLLQGSYRNGTALADINDVDIVARKRRTKHPLEPDEWEALFAEIAYKLEGSSRIPGQVKLGDKCVKLETPTLNADVVPAIAIRRFENDPIAVWSRRANEPTPNYPRTHIRRGSRKHARTGERYKPAVRLVKRWARQYFDGTDIAPSFFIECAVYSVRDTKFHPSLPLSFLRVGREICAWTEDDVIKSVAGDKDILVDAEWDPRRFRQFQERLLDDLEYVRQAIAAPTTRRANALWAYAFGD